MVIAAFEGWNDAGEAASAAVTHLSSVWDATAIGEIDPEDFYDFQVTRPVLEVTDGQTRAAVLADDEAGAGASGRAGRA